MDAFQIEAINQGFRSHVAGQVPQSLIPPFPIKGMAEQAMKNSMQIEPGAGRPPLLLIE